MTSLYAQANCAKSVLVNIAAIDWIPNLSSQQRINHRYIAWAIPVTTLTQERKDMSAISSVVYTQAFERNDRGSPRFETNVKLLNRKWGQKHKFSRKEIPTSEAPTTIIRALMVTCNNLWSADTL